MQQGGGVQYGASASEMSDFPQADQQLKLGDPTIGAAEEASPISSRPPATAHFASAASMDELLRVGAGVGGLPDDDALGGDDGDRGGASGGNRWPRQETLALLKIRSDMDAVFRDASLKGPLWEDVSRKLGELGYKRNAKKCKEKFENVHKYYKRTKESRAGRQDGKSYRFFSQLEALHNTVISSPTPPVTPSTTMITTSAAVPIGQIAAPVPVPVSVGIGVGNPMSIPMPVSSVRAPSPFLATPQPPHTQPQPQLPSSIALFPQDYSAVTGAPSGVAPLGVSFSSDSSSSSSGSDEMGDEEDDMDLEGDFMATMGNQQRKRKRESSRQRGSSSEKMMEFFEGLMKQVMQKQETMQQKFLEAIEKREQDRMIRDEAWKRQEMSRLAREHELMAQERAISASRDSAIIAFLQKITGQTIQLPQPLNIPIPCAAPPPPSPSPPPPQQQPSVSVPPPIASILPPQTQLYQKPQPQPPQQQHYQQQQQPPPSQHQTPPRPPQQQHPPQPPPPQQQLVQHHPQPSGEVATTPQPQAMSQAIVVAVPEQQVAPHEMSGSGVFEATSSRWPKTEVLALIKIRSGLEPRYQEAGPKGPLWEEVSAGMGRMGYNRNPKRCKEKWENINKYFKKVKESNKKRPEDAKTCPYFHELDTLYRKKILGSPSGSSSLAITHNRPEEQQPQHPPLMLPIPPTQTSPTQHKDTVSNIDIQTSNGGLTATLFGEATDSGVIGVPKKPEDIVKDQQVQKHQQPLMRNGFDKIEEPDSDNLDLEEDEYEDEDEDEDEDDEDAQEEMKMAYKIQYQRPNAGSSNGGGNGASSFLAMVQ